RPGVYVLWAPGEGGELPRAYIGKSDAVANRLDHHVRNKDFWTHAVLFTSKDQNLNTAHVGYLEHRLYDIAAKAKRCELVNEQTPQKPPLSEADVAYAEGFLEGMLLCLPLMGVSCFEVAKAVKRKGTRLFLNAKAIQAEGMELPEGFLVRAGSLAVGRETPSVPKYVSRLRETLVAKEVLLPEGERLRLAQDYFFTSPSTASGVMLGASSNGRDAWEDKNGRSLKELQEDNLSAQ
ncbi:MAG: GIY-YIG nuclease family protein, partial [Cyanobacteria bacterium J06638_22]